MGSAEKLRTPYCRGLILSVAACLGISWAQRSVDTLAIVGANLIDVRKGVAIEQRVVLAAKDRITAVGRIGELAIPSGAKVVDAPGKWVIPGLVDMHVHVSSSLTAAPGYP